MIIRINAKRGFLGLLSYQRYEVVFAFLFSSLVYGAYEFHGLSFLASFNYVPLGFISAVLSVFLAFRNNNSYSRWWEARTLWGDLVNSSRTFGMQVLSMLTPPEKSDLPETAISQMRRELIMRHLAFINLTRMQLRGELRLDHVESYLSDEDLEVMRQSVNPAVQINRIQSESLRDAMKQGWLSDFRLVAMMETLERFYNILGACERIKNTPFPREYDVFIRLMIWLLDIVLPIYLLSVFSDDISKLLIIPFTVITALIVGFANKAGDMLENPFENCIHDIPLFATLSSAICCNSFGKREFPSNRRSAMALSGNNRNPNPEMQILDRKPKAKVILTDDSTYSVDVNPFDNDLYHCAWKDTLKPTLKIIDEHGDFIVHRVSHLKGLIPLKEVRLNGFTSTWGQDLTEERARDFIDLTQNSQWDYARILCRSDRAQHQHFSLLQEAGLDVVQVPISPMYSIDLAQGWDAYMASKSVNARRNINQKLKKSQEYNPYLKTFSGSEELEFFLDRFIPLHQAYWNKKTGSSYLNNPAEQAFLRLWAQSLHESGHLLLEGLYYHDELVNLCLHIQNEHYLSSPLTINTGKYLEGFPGIVTIYLSIQNAISRGLTQYNMGAGGQLYKLQAASHQIPTFEILIPNPKSWLGMRYVQRLIHKLSDAHASVAIPDSKAQPVAVS